MRVQVSICSLLCLMLAGCGGGTAGSSGHIRLDCGTTGISVNPGSAMADHNADPPGNTTRFSAETLNPGKCPTPALLPDWSVSDTTSVSIISAKDSTNGTATCLNEASAPVVVTATSTVDGKIFTATAQLTCK